MERFKNIPLEEYNSKMSQALLFNNKIKVIYNNQSGYIPNQEYIGEITNLTQLSWCLATVLTKAGFTIQSNYVISLEILNN